jgi:UDPglucose 6-dehydrogenase
MRIVVVGSGYVGLVSGTCLAETGHSVTCVDIDAKKIETLTNGHLHMFEPRLEAMMVRNLEAGRLFFSTAIEAEVSKADVIFIAVGTPSRASDGHADLSYINKACLSAGKAMRNGAIIVLKSTVPVGTSDVVERTIRAARPDLDFAVASNPEFLREGNAVDDFMRPDRIVIGTVDQETAKVLHDLYRPMFDDEAPILFTDRRTSEIIKYASNAFLATKVAFINEVAELCERVGANVTEVAEGMGRDPRIGPAFLRAGPGYGGSCFPKDTSALIRIGQDAGVPMRIVEAVAASNDNRKRSVALKVVRAMGGDLRGKRVALLGLAFKANTDDTRDSPAIVVATVLRDAGAHVVAFDPKAMGQAAEMGIDLELAESAMSCVAGADAMVVITEWPEFAHLDFKAVRTAMRDPLVIDLRNLLDAERLKRLGLRYVGTGNGRPPRRRPRATRAKVIAP